MKSTHSLPSSWRHLGGAVTLLVCGLLLSAGCGKNPEDLEDGGQTDLAQGADMARGGPDLAVAVTGLPCPVEATLKASCLRCHGRPLQRVPLALETYEDLMATSKIDPTKKIADRVVARMKDAQSPMPPKPGRAVPAGEIAAVEGWVQAGAPRTTCNAGLVGM